MKDNIIKKITPDEALIILKHLSKSDDILKKKITDLAEGLFKNVDIEEICVDVFYTLDGIDVHELWDRSGTTRDGYSSPEEMSVEMFDEALEPFVQEMKRLLELEICKEAKEFCMGILKGIYQYEHESKSEFKDWASDLPGESFGDVLREWSNGCNESDKAGMTTFIKKEFPDWSSWAINQI